MKDKSKIFEPPESFSARGAHPEARRAEGSREILPRFAPQDEGSKRDKNSPTPQIFIVSGPSGCGKTTLCRTLRKKVGGLTGSVSVTTRVPRKGEIKNKDYIFVTEAEFKEKLTRGFFIEYAKTFGFFYATPKAPILDAIKRGEDVLLSIDVKGAAQLKRVFKNAVLIFILPPSFNDLKKRLLQRSSDSGPQIEKRLKIARQEMRALSMYDYAVINDDMSNAVEKLAAIVTAERCKIMHCQLNE